MQVRLANRPASSRHRVDHRRRSRVLTDGPDELRAEQIPVPPHPVASVPLAVQTCQFGDGLQIPRKLGRAGRLVQGEESI